MAEKTAKNFDSISGYMMRIYELLAAEGIVESKELETLKSWLGDLKDLGHGN